MLFHYVTPKRIYSWKLRSYTANKVLLAICIKTVFQNLSFADFLYSFFAPSLRGCLKSGML